MEFSQEISEILTSLYKEGNTIYRVDIIREIISGEVSIRGVKGYV